MIDKINTLKQLITSGIHKYYIEPIRFPFYRNLEAETKITFDFQVTFLVGKNGGDKTIVLLMKCT